MSIIVGLRTVQHIRTFGVSVFTWYLHSLLGSLGVSWYAGKCARCGELAVSLVCCGAPGWPAGCDLLASGRPGTGRHGRAHTWSELSTHQNATRHDIALPSYFLQIAGRYLGRWGQNGDGDGVEGREVSQAPGSESIKGNVHGKKDGRKKVKGEGNKRKREKKALEESSRKELRNLSMEEQEASKARGLKENEGGEPSMIKGTKSKGSKPSSKGDKLKDNKKSKGGKSKAGKKKQAIPMGSQEQYTSAGLYRA